MKTEEFKLPFETYIDGQALGDYNTTPCLLNTPPGKLTAKILPKSERDPEEYLEEPFYLHLSETPISDYRDLEQHIDEMDGKEIPFSEFSRLTEYGKQEISAELKSGFFYDLFAFGQQNGKGIVVGNRRLWVQDGDIPYDLTLDSMRLIALESLGLTPKETKGLSAKITPMMSWGERNGRTGRMFWAGFYFGKDDEECNVDVSVNDLGEVSHHPYSAEEVVKYLRETRQID